MLSFLSFGYSFSWFFFCFFIFIILIHIFTVSTMLFPFQLICVRQPFFLSHRFFHFKPFNLFQLILFSGPSFYFSTAALTFDFMVLCWPFVLFLSYPMLSLV
mmetsp:Transcript_18314/g.40560  ORF Transcript_18314/g.40560 Transcript_18314/m.40560 type:complete len:102 (-) Transcript_18314:436-741(-)